MHILHAIKSCSITFLCDFSVYIDAGDVACCFCTASSWFSLWEKILKMSTQSLILSIFFTCHYSKTVWLAENLNVIKITHYEKIFFHIKQTFSHFEKGLRNVLTKKKNFCLTEINIIFTKIHRIKTKPKTNYQNI